MSGFELIEGAQAPIKAWTRGVPVEHAAENQLRNVASLPFIHSHIAVMPDVHFGRGPTVGSVIPTKGAIIPVPGPVAASVRSWRLLHRLTGRTPEQLEVTADPSFDPEGGSSRD